MHSGTHPQQYAPSEGSTQLEGSTTSTGWHTAILLVMQTERTLGGTHPQVHCGVLRAEAVLKLKAAL